jgi:hypothetical protein
MLHSERRKHRRYMVEGKAVVESGSRQFAGALVDISEGGVLLITVEENVPVGARLEVSFGMDGYPVEINSKGIAVRAAPNVIAMAFSDPPWELYQAILWLEAGFLANLVPPKK